MESYPSIIDSSIISYSITVDSIMNIYSFNIYMIIYKSLLKTKVISW